jgi:hypothetical protein
MSGRPWIRFLFWFGCVLVVVGVAPIAYLIWFGAAHNFQPLSMPLPLKHGEYTSAVFKTDLNETYQITREHPDRLQSFDGTL